uniref:Uncharacterized protein n=1 Tax=Arundo donax TaxID=35708 RepID=A0A0A8XXZ7_ARUDO
MQNSGRQRVAGSEVQALLWAVELARWAAEGGGTCAADSGAPAAGRGGRLAPFPARAAAPLFSLVVH